MIVAAISEAVNRVENRGGDAPPTRAFADGDRGASLPLLSVVSGGTLGLRDGISAFILFKGGVCYYDHGK